MKLIQSILLFLGVAAAVSGAATQISHAENTATARFSIVNQDTPQLNTTFPVIVYAHTGNIPVHVAVLELQYDANKLQFIGVDESNNGLLNAYHPEAVGSTVTIARYRIEPMAETNVFAVVQFKALASTGGASVSVGSGSQIYHGKHNIWNAEPAAITVGFQPLRLATTTTKQQHARDTLKPVADSAAQSETLGAMSQSNSVVTAPAATEQPRETELETPAVIRLNAGTVAQSDTNVLIVTAYGAALALLVSSLVVVRTRYKRMQH